MSTPRRSRVLWAAALVAALTLFFASSSSAFAADLVVNDDAAPCAFGPAPYNTIQSAVSAAVAGDTIKVCNGNYTGPFPINKDLTI